MATATQEPFRDDVPVAVEDNLGLFLLLLLGIAILVVTLAIVLSILRAGKMRLAVIPFGRAAAREGCLWWIGLASAVVGAHG